MYAIGASDLCAASVGAPHIRQRLFFVADASGERIRTSGLATNRAASGRNEAASRERQWLRADVGTIGAGAPVRMGDPDNTRLEGRELPAERSGECAAGPSGVAGPWANADWIPCRDGKLRPVEPGTFPLVDGAPARMVRLRGYGNAINAEVAAKFIRAADECLNDAIPAQELRAA